ncbi:MAG: ABC transporter permease [Gemmatimonadaceae bacterium]
MSRIPGIRRLFRIERDAADIQRDVDDELRFHIERTVEELVAAGRSPEDARREAETRFADLRAVPRRLVEIDRGRVRRERRAEWWESLWQDVRYGGRSLLRAPGFTAAAVLTLGIGMGANAALFSVVDGVLLRPAPFAGLDRVAMIWETDRASGTTREPASIPDYRDFRERVRTFEEITAFTPLELSLSPDAADPERVAGLGVSHEWFALLGVRPLVGRAFTAEEDMPGGPRAAIISEDLWTRLFQRDPNVTGRTLRLNDVTWSIVGVLPRGSDFGVLQTLGAASYMRGFADRGDRVRVDVWLPLRPAPNAQRGNHPIFVAGRLAQGASFTAAQHEMTAITADLEREYPQENAARGAFVEPMEAVVFGDVRQALLVLLGAVVMVLLVACANVVNLQLVRSTARSREVIIRTSLGAVASRLAQQFFVEAAMLAAAGAAVGVSIAFGAVAVLRALAPATIPRAETMAVDGRALLLTGVLATVIAVVVGLLPTLRARRLDISQSLHAESARGAAGGGRARRSLRATLVVAELGMAPTLMAGAGLLIRSLWELRAVHPGFDASGVLKAEFQLPATRYPIDFTNASSATARLGFLHEVVERLSALPGVESVALATANPMDAGFTSSIRVIGREAEAENWPEPSIRTVSASYFETLRVRVLDGRAFAASDGPASARVLIINTAARDQFFAGREPLGAQVNLWGANRTVIGVVDNERIRGLASVAPPAVYMPLAQIPVPSAVFVRMEGSDAAVAAPLVRRVIREIDPQLALFGVEPLEDTISGTLAQRRYTMLVLAAFALAALVLAAVGVHGVLSYAVAQRTREIGVRVALGADAGRVQAYVLRDGARMVGLGLLLGLAGALALSQAMRALVFGITPHDPLTLAGVTAVLGGVALLASWLPARRASRVDPMVALRSE